MSIQLTPIGTFETGIFDDGAAEINAYDSGSQRLFVINSNAAQIDVLDVSDPSNPVLEGTIDATAVGAGANSVAVNNGMVAVAIESDPSTDPGTVVFFSADADLASLDLAAETAVEVGSLPDAVTFTPDGSKLLVANEGEPDDGVDPEGSISIIDTTTFTVETATFTAFNGQEDALRDAGVRLFPGIDVANDVEPEFIAVSPDGTTAFVTLQEANAVAVVDIATATVTEIQPLGVKDHSELGNGFDASDEDGFINIKSQPVVGLYQPDSIASFEADGQVYYVTANEGDDRGDADDAADSPLGDAVRLADLGDVETFGRSGLALDDSITSAFPNIADENQLGRLTISSIDGDTDGDGDIDVIHSYGARSFSIFDADGNLVFDSGDDFEQITASVFTEDFNSDNDENGSFDSRSDAKGPEPEGVVVGEVDGKTYAFVGLERVGGVMVYDITDPANSSFVDYVNNRDFSGDAEAGTAGDLGPEGLTFIPADDSPNNEALLAVSNEVSGTTTLYQVEDIEPMDSGTVSTKPSSGSLSSVTS
ncbi:MAG: choice-of-anchor I family protein [Cyanobacteria bacterium J06626_14]